MNEPTPSRAAVAAAKLGCTEGQLYTMAIAVVLAVLLSATGIPAVLRDQPAAAGADTALRPFDRGEDPDGATTTTEVEPPQQTATPPGRRAARTIGPPRPDAGGRAPARVVPPPSGGVARAPVPGTIGLFAAVGAPGAPGGIAVGRDGTVFVTTDNGSARGRPGPSHVFSYGRDGTPSGDLAVTGQPAEREGGLAGVAVHPATGALAIADPAGARVVGLDPASGAQALLAEIPDLPACVLPGAGVCQPGVGDRRPFPVSAAHDSAGNLYVADPAQDTIWRVRAGAASAEVWYQSLQFSSGDGPFGVAFDGATMVVTVGAANEVAAFGAGALYRLAVNPDGAAGDLRLVHSFAAGDRPGSLAVGSSGTAYVVLRDSGAVVSIAPDGSESGRVEPPGSGPVPLDGPSGVAVVRGALLVANGRTSADPGRWAVLTVAVNDGPRP